jgi:hypothetical protein
MRYYFQSFKAIPKRRKTVAELVELLKIEEATRDAFDKNAQEDLEKGDKVKAPMWLGYWKDWESYCSAWKTRIESISQSDYSLDLLNAHEKITIEEAFCILIGITPDALDEVGFLNWRLSEVPRFLKIYRERLDEQRPHYGEVGIMPTFLNIEQHLRGTKEYKQLVREFGEPTDEQIISEGFETIDTQEFIDWAMKMRWIIETEPHLRGIRKAPYHSDFARMLHSLLTKHKIINGKFESKWEWLSSENSLAYLVELLHQNSLPFQWHADNSHRGTICWTSILHYIDYQGDSPLRNNAQYGKNGVKVKFLLNQTIDSLLVDYEGYKFGRKDEFLELE